MAFGHSFSLCYPPTRSINEKRTNKEKSHMIIFTTKFASGCSDFLFIFVENALLQKNNQGSIINLYSVTKLEPVCGSTVINRKSYAKVLETF